MHRMKVIFVSFLLTLSLGQATGEELSDEEKVDSTLHWGEVRVIDIDQLRGDQCKFLKRETCTSKKGYAYCNRWFQKRAVGEKANTVAILSKEKEFNLFSLSGTVATAQGEYYHCVSTTENESNRDDRYKELRE